MKVIITGSSGDIGSVVASRFLKLGHSVYGIDMLPAKISNPNYIHFCADIKNKSELPDIRDADILFNNAGLQNSKDDITNNLTGTIKVTEKYIKSCNLKSILFNASASAISGQEFPEYAASKAGILGYMKNVAIRLAPFGTTVNTVCFGGVYTSSNNTVLNNSDAMKKIMAVTPLKKWMSVEETADWVLFLTLQNRSMSGQNLLIDNGEYNLNPMFVWDESCPISQRNV